MDESRNEKAGVIRYALETLGITDTSKIVMIGDRKYDVIGASENNIETIGVLYGFGSEDELLSAGAKYIAPTTADIFKFV